MWNLEPPPGFQGLREDLPLRIYIRHMPHWRQDGATYFVTFRLADSLPENRRRELEGLKADWERRHPPPRSKDMLEQLARMVFERVEHWLDQGSGRCVLGRDDAAKEVAKSLLHFQHDRYEVGCSVVMPNHVHAIVRPLKPPAHELEDILGSWKSYTARRINQLITDEESDPEKLWQDESYDRIIRDEEHLWRSLLYIARNPKKAGLSNVSCYLWLNPDWEKLGWRFEDAKT